MNKKPAAIGIDARLWNETGVGRYIRNLVENLARVDTKNRYVLFLTADMYQTLPLPGENFQKQLADIRWHTLAEQLHFAQLIYQQRLDLVHFPYFSYPLFYRKKFILTIHDLILHHFPTGKASTLPPIMYNAKLFGYKFLLTMGARHAEKILTVSEATKTEIIDHLHVKQEKIVVTYEGVDDVFLHRRDRKNQEGKPYFLYVGNAYPHKNLEGLLEGFSLLLKKEKRVRLFCVGKNDFFYQRLQKKIAGSSLSEYVIFKHEVSDTQLADLYSHAQATIIPSFMEGFGLPALEALACGCLVVSADIPALHELCKESAVYFDPRNSVQLAERLYSILQHPQSYTRYRSDGKNRVNSFSWEKMAVETVHVYENSISI